MKIKKIGINACAIAVFVLTLCYGMDFDISALFSIKLIGIMILGTVILFIPSLVQGIKKEEIPELIGQNARTAGYIGTFIILFYNLKNLREPDGFLEEIALSCRSVLYGFIVYEIFRNRKKEEKISEDRKKGEEPLKERLAAAGLTAREIQIALLIHKDFSNKEVAEELYIAETTVKKHVSNIFDKLGIEKRSQIR